MRPLRDGADRGGEGLAAIAAFPIAGGLFPSKPTEFPTTPQCGQTAPSGQRMALEVLRGGFSSLYIGFGWYRNPVHSPGMIYGYRWFRAVVGVI